MKPTVVRDAPLGEIFLTPEGGTESGGLSRSLLTRGGRGRAPVRELARRGGGFLTFLSSSHLQTALDLQLERNFEAAAPRALETLV